MNVLGRGVPVERLRRMAFAIRIPACVRSAHAPNLWGMPMNAPFRSYDSSGAAAAEPECLIRSLS